MRALYILAALAFVAPACFFELGELVESEAGAGGGGGGAGGGPASTSSSSGGGGGIPTDWWDGRFLHRIRIDLVGVTADVADARLPVVLPGDFAYGDALPDGSDLRFIDDDGATTLSYELERYDAMAGSVIWVRVPEVSGDGDHIWLYYGRPDALAQSDPATVWGGYQGVYHLDEDPAQAMAIADASPNQNDGTPAGFSAGASVEGRHGLAVDFGPSGMRNIAIEEDDGFDVGAGEDLTLELWFKWDPAGGGGYLVAKEACCVGYAAVMLATNGILRQTWRSGSCCATPPEGDYTFTQRSLPGNETDSDWHHAVLIWDRSVSQTSRWYLDGVLWQEEAIDAAPGQGGFGQLFLGADFGGGSSFSGIIDEIRFAKRIYGVPEIQLNQAAAEGSLLSFGSVESL